MQAHLNFSGNKGELRESNKQRALPHTPSMKEDPEEAYIIPDVTLEEGKFNIFYI
jgi:hypothetical protein